jgi:hypothetical protein
LETSFDDYTSIYLNRRRGFVVRYSSKHLFNSTLALLLLATATLPLPLVDAKKKAGASVKAMQKEWEPNAKKLAMLLEKTRSRKLFTPEDANTLTELMKAGSSIQGKYATSEEGASILYDLGTLYMYREKYFEAYDVFSTIQQYHDGTTLGRKAVYQISRIKSTMGDDFTPLETSLPATASAKPAKKSGSKK